jgi:hypothetical protein
MPSPIDNIAIQERIALDSYDRPIFSIHLNGHEALFTKVIFNEIPHYISFPVERESRFVERNGVQYEMIQSLPRNFNLLQDNGQNSGVLVITESNNGFFMDNCMLYVPTTRQSSE